MKQLTITIVLFSMMSFLTSKEPINIYNFEVIKNSFNLTIDAFNYSIHNIVKDRGKGKGRPIRV